MPGFFGSSHLEGHWSADNIWMAHRRMEARSKVIRRHTHTDRGNRGSQSQLALNLGERKDVKQNMEHE